MHWEIQMHYESVVCHSKIKHRCTNQNSKYYFHVFRHLRTVYVDWVPEGQTVNQVYKNYKKVLIISSWEAHGFFNKVTLQHTTHCPSRHLWSSMEFPCWIIHYTYLIFPLCDFFLFPKVKSALKGTHFESTDEGKSNRGYDLMKKLSENNLQHRFQQ